MHTVFIFVSCEEKSCYRIVSLGHQNFDCRSYCRLSRRMQGDPCRRQSRSQSFVPLDQRSENESSGSIHFQITMEIIEFCISGFTVHACAVRSLHVWYLWRMPEMDAPRALVFRPLVKGNEALGTRLCRRRIVALGTRMNCHFDICSCVRAIFVSTAHAQVDT